MTQIGEGIAALFGWGGPAEPGSLKVTVTERDSDEPVAGVQVTLHGPTPVCAVTPGDGVVRFSGLEPGLYWATAAEPEFEIGRGKWMVHVGAGENETMTMRITRILLTVLLKRIPIGVSLAQVDVGVGHWWTEIDGIESYGWYPAERPGVGGIFGVPGQLNGRIGSKGTPTRDAHHGEDADYMFHPRIMNGSSAVAVKNCIRAFARAYSGEWAWPWRQNCHTFQEAMMKHCGLAEQELGKSVNWMFND